MKTFSLSSRGPLTRNRIITLGFFAAALLLAYVVAGGILAGDATTLAMMATITVAGVAGLAILVNWRNGTYFFLCWLLFEDFARKFLGNNMAIYFAKDVLLLFVYASFFVAWRRKDRDVQVFRPSFLTVLFVFVWYGVLQVFNPASTSIFYGLLGMKLYFYYMPLLVIGYAMINSEADLRKFLYINLALMLVIAALGIFQSVLGPRFLNPAVMADDIRLLSETYRVAPISGARIYRPTSVFVSTGRFADLLIVGWFVTFGFSGFVLLRHRRGRILAFLSLALMAAACVMASSRGVVMWTSGSAIVGAVAFLWGAPWRQREVLRVVRGLQRIALGIILAVVVMMLVYPQAFLDRLAVFSETLDPRSPASELTHRAGAYPLQNFLAAFDYSRWPYGYGIGSISLGAQYVTRFFHAAPPVGSVESGFGAIVVEMGIVGLALWIIMSVSIALSAWRVVRILKGSPLFPLAFMIFWYSVILLLPMTFASMTPYQDFIMNAYLWLLLGILFRLPKLTESGQPQPSFAGQPDLSERAR
jgi:hypothetical protein